MFNNSGLYVKANFPGRYSVLVHFSNSQPLVTISQIVYQSYTCGPKEVEHESFYSSIAMPYRLLFSCWLVNKAGGKVIRDSVIIFSAIQGK